MIRQAPRCGISSSVVGPIRTLGTVEPRWHVHDENFPMSDAFIVEMSPPKHQGMTFDFSAGDQHVRQNFATHIYPFLDRLIGAIRVLRDGFVDEKIILFLGAPECGLCIQADAGSPEAVLRLDVWPDSRRGKPVQVKTLFSLRTTRQEIISPFVAALRRLRESINDADFAREYGSPFPIREYDQLMALMG